MKWFMFLLLMAAFPAHADEKPAKLELYAFYNGMPAGMSYDDEAKMLGAMGYAGISQVYAKEGGQLLADRAAVYKKHGVKVLSLYLEATDCGRRFESRMIWAV